MGLFSKKNDKKNDDRRTSDQLENDSATDSVDVDGRLGLPEDVSMNSLDYLDNTGELLTRSAPTVSSQDGATGGGWHMPDIDGPNPDNDLGTEESFATFFGDDAEASSDLDSFVPDSYDPESLQQESLEHHAPVTDPFETADETGWVPSSPEATEHFSDHDRRLDDQPPMAAAGTSELAATSDFLAVDLPDFDNEPTDVDQTPAEEPLEVVDDPFAPPPGVAAPLLGTSNPLTPEPPSIDVQPAPEPAMADFGDETDHDMAEFGDEAEAYTAPQTESLPVVETQPGADEDVDMAALALASSVPKTPVAAPAMPASDQLLPEGIDVDHDGPIGSRAATLLEILGLDPNATWTEIGDTHRELSVELSESIDGDPSREAVSRAIQREMNTAYAALRLMAVG